MRSTLRYSMLMSFAMATLYAPHAVSKSSDAALAARVGGVLAQTPLIDGHNDLVWT
jgi:hypothetical protein